MSFESHVTGQLYKASKANIKAPHSIQRSYSTLKSVLKLTVYVKKRISHFMGAFNILKARTGIRRRLLHFRHCSFRTIAQGMLKLTSVSHLVPASTQSRDNSVRLLRAFSSRALNFSKGTTFSYKVFEPLFQCLTIFTVITFLLITNTNFPCCNFYPFLSTGTLRWVWLNLLYTLTLDSGRQQAVQFPHKPHVLKAG